MGNLTPVALSGSSSSALLKSHPAKLNTPVINWPDHGRTSLGRWPLSGFSPPPIEKRLRVYLKTEKKK